MSDSIVQYKSLGFLGFPNYRVGDDGSVWSLHRSGRAPYETEVEIHRLNREGISPSEISKRLSLKYNLVYTAIRRKPKENKWRRLNCSGGKSYPCVVLCHKGKKRTYDVQQLVLLAFVGPCPEGMEARHFPDPDRKNCHLNNLQWATRKQNAQDRIFHGVARGGSNKGEVNGRAELRPEEVRQARKVYSTGKFTVKDIHSTMFPHVSLATMYDVIARRTWRHI